MTRRWTVARAGAALLATLCAFAALAWPAFAIASGWHDLNLPQWITIVAQSATGGVLAMFFYREAIHDRRRRG
jgi:hypothetical protein